MNDSHHQLKEVYWRSRRGMLELELKLVPFVRDCYEALDDVQKRAYVDLLGAEDWQIFDWLQGRDTPSDPALQSVIAQISGYAGRL